MTFLSRETGRAEDYAGIGDEPNASKRNGQFIVIAENAGSSQAFTWEVKAARADIASLEVEP